MNILTWLRQCPQKYWRVAILLIGVSLGLTGAWWGAVQNISWAGKIILALIGALVGGGGLFILNLLVWQAERVARLEQTVQQLPSWINVRPITQQTPLELGGWSIEPLLAEKVAQLIFRQKPSLIVECGAGDSTVFMAACLAQLGQGKVVAAEHDPEFAQQTRNRLQTAGLEQWAKIVTAPLERRSLPSGQAMPWYAINFEEVVQQQTEDVELLLVDGPPGTTTEQARWPAVPLLQPFLAPNCTIILDDGQRVDEQTIARKWADQFNLERELLQPGRGAWLFSPKK